MSEEHEENITRAVKLLSSLGSGAYAPLRVIDLKGEVHTFYRYQLTDEQVELLTNEYCFIRVEVRDGKEFANKCVPIDPLMLRVMSETTQQRNP